jgi:hypothetical protein
MVFVERYGDLQLSAHEIREKTLSRHTPWRMLDAEVSIERKRVLI